MSLISPHDLCLDQSFTTPCQIQPGVSPSHWQRRRVSLTVINYITTTVRAGADWDWWSELQHLRVICMSICGPITRLSDSFSPLLSLNHACLSVCICAVCPWPGPSWDERPCHVWRELNHLEDEQWCELPSDILAQHSAEILEKPCLATDSG